MEEWKVGNGRLRMDRGRYNMHDAGCKMQDRWWLTGDGRRGTGEKLVQRSCDDPPSAVEGLAS